MMPNHPPTSNQCPLPPAVQLIAQFQGVRTVSQGLKKINGTYTRTNAWVFYVAQKKSLASLLPVEIIPTEIDGVPTDVEKEWNADDFTLLSGAADGTRYRDPLTGGIQIGTKADAIVGHVGTLGCFALKNDDRSIVLLSNYHVLYSNGTATGGNIYQPGGASTPDDDVIGTTLGGTINADVDAAIAAVTLESSSSCCCKRPLDYRQRVHNTTLPAGANITGTTTAAKNMIVYMTGINGHSTGLIVNISKSLDFDVDYSAEAMTNPGPFPRFTNQIVIISFDDSTKTPKPKTPFANKGDSGSVVMDANGRVVGLLFGTFVQTATGDIVSIANHIAKVELNLGITVFAYNPAGKATAAIDPPTAEEIALGDLVLDNVTPVSGTRSTAIAEIPEPTLHWILDSFPELDVHESIRHLIRKHYQEIARLVNECKPVTVAWQRSQGPGWLTHFFTSLKNPVYSIPTAVKGITLPALIRRMDTALLQEGSASLKKDLMHYTSDWLTAATTFQSAQEFITRLNELICQHKQVQ